MSTLETTHEIIPEIDLNLAKTEARTDSTINQPVKIPKEGVKDSQDAVSQPAIEARLKTYQKMAKPKIVPTKTRLSPKEQAAETVRQAFDPTIPILTPKKARHKRIAALVVQGEKTYTQIGKEIGIEESTHIRQNVYSRLQSASVKAEIQALMEPRKAQLERIASKIVNKLERKIDSVDDLDDLKQGTLRTLEMQYKEQAMLTDRVATVDETPKLEDIEAKALASLKIGRNGIQQEDAEKIAEDAEKIAEDALQGTNTAEKMAKEAEVDK
jgi:hypothetical protein